MDLLKLIIDSDLIKRTCFLCFKPGVFFTNLHDKNEICDEYFNYYISLRYIMKELFPAHEILFSQACGDCTSLLLKVFMLLQRNHWKNEFLSHLLQDINRNLDKEVYTEKKITFKIHTPTFDNLLKGNKVYKCAKCLMEFKSKLLLNKHIKIKHKNVNETIVCHICGKIFKKSLTLKYHPSYHEAKQCPFCSKQLKSHFNVHIKNNKELIKRERSKKYYNCVNCKYKTLYKTSLDAHNNKVHLNTRPYICKICLKGFYKNSNLVEHTLTHAGKYKVCDICGNNFANDKTLKEHLRLHTGHKPFECGLCNSSFISSSRLYEHMARKHKEKTESCDICDKMFSLKKDLRSHLKTVHKVNLN